jgi:2-polyprenyl-6-methoxyphenol hydroxylase-like FAD-dependent oxidoreductase
LITNNGAKPITILGGGLAGLTLGLSLRREGVPVTVYEAGHYPRHRVCGEFISGLGLQVLARLELLEPFRQAGAIPGNTAAFVTRGLCSPPRRLDPPALCLSRWTMDALLAKRFRAAGGDLFPGERRREPTNAEGLVCATGRMPLASKNGCRWFGLKIHARNVPIAADVEMHVFPHGYVGLSRVEGGAVNVCGLFIRPINAPEATSPSRELLRGPANSLLAYRLADAVFDDNSFCAVGGLGLHPRRAAGRSECCVGDALTMIPPVTGNGMSMAFEAADLATVPLAAYSRGKLSWRDARASIAYACDQAFRRRLAWATWLQSLMFSPLARGPLAGILLRSGWIWRFMFAHTRC